MEDPKTDTNRGVKNQQEILRILRFEIDGEWAASEFAVAFSALTYLHRIGEPTKLTNIELRW
ncbi:MAG: hypothetical protein NTV51_15805, partial [Verrucomicrobia bacterium]|nr:hypothetical protein [Verrucomicrobiota bacterium]